MGFLTVNGKLMTYDEYKNVQAMYKVHGLLQFMKLYNIHKDRQIEEKDLHWGEEIEYHTYAFDEDNKKVRLVCDADDVIEKFSQYQNLLDSFKNDDQNKDDVDIGLFGFNDDERTDLGEPDFKLLPEFGNFMIEAVPLEPYGSYSDPNELLKCEQKISNR